jgi:hypothetical protein
VRAETYKLPAQSGIDRDAHQPCAEVAEATHDAEELGLVAHLRGHVRLTGEHGDLALWKRRAEQRPKLAAHDDAADPSARRSADWRTITVHRSLVVDQRVSATGPAKITRVTGGSRAWRWGRPTQACASVDAPARPASSAPGCFVRWGSDRTVTRRSSLRGLGRSGRTHSNVRAGTAQDAPCVLRRRHGSTAAPACRSVCGSAGGAPSDDRRARSDRELPRRPIARRSTPQICVGEIPRRTLGREARLLNPRGAASRPRRA